MNNCIFCKIAKHEAPAHIIYEDGVLMAILDINPISDGHTLIIPKKDVKDLYALDKETGSQIMQLAKKLAKAIEKEFGFDGSSIMESNGAFQDVPHFHLHVFGRHKNNDIKLATPRNIKNDTEHLKTVAQKIRFDNQTTKTLKSKHFQDFPAAPSEMAGKISTSKDF